MNTAKTLIAFTMMSISVFAQPDEGSKKSIEASRESWGRYLHDKQLDAAMSLYTNDAVFFDPEGTQVRGKASIQKLFSTVMKTFTSEIHFTSIALEVSGDLAYDSGEYHEDLVATAGGARRKIRGTYLTVLKHGPDGKWRIVQQMWTQAPTATHP